MLLQELRYALRNLWKAPTFALTAILTLALGIGASTAVFTIVNSVVLRPLRYRDSQNLAVIWERVKFLINSSTPYTGANPRHAALWNERNRSFSSICLLGTGTRGVSLGTGHPRLVGSIRAQPNFLEVLEVTPALGRGFQPNDAIPGRDQVAILAHSLWITFFQGDPHAIGKIVHIGDAAYQVIGVLPENFEFPKRNILNSFPSRQGTAAAPPVEILTPLAIDPNQYGWNSDYGNWVALGRLKPGISAAQAEADINHLQRQIIQEMGAGERTTDPDALLAYVQPLQDAMVGNSRRALWLLLGAVIGLMLIACVNLANAQLGRAVTREREAAVRSALGASQFQMLWSSLAESLLLAAFGGVAGIALAFEIIGAFQRYAPIDLPRMTEIEPNAAVLAFAFATVAGSALLFGLLPALRFVRADTQRALQQNTARSSGSRRARHSRLALIGLQVFGCTVLLLLSGLFTKSLLTLLHSERGFDAENVAVAEVLLRGHSYDQDARRMAFTGNVLAHLRQLPGVTATAAVSAMPLEGETWIESIHRPGKPVAGRPLWNVRWVTTEYFAVMREHLAAGRFFEDSDRATRNAVISASSARAGWPGENPIGQQFQWRDQRFTVVGVVADAKTNSLKNAPVNMLYLPVETLPPFTPVFLTRGNANPGPLLQSIRQTIWSEDPEATISRVKTLDSQIADSLSAERFQTWLLGAFGLAALLLAMLGVYAILSYTTAARTREIGLRIALGATARGIYRLTLFEAAIPVAGGLLAGWAASIAAARFVQSLLYNVVPTDWTVATMVSVLLVTSAAAASLLPARRAASVDPMEALRMD